MGNVAKPKIVSAGEWQQARDELLKAEKEATRVLDALAARRRRLPMVKFGAYVFDTPGGPKTLAELFGGHDQLVTYQFMDLGPGKFCPACTGSMNEVTGLDQLAEAGVTWVTVSNMPLSQIEPYKAQMGWTFPFVSSQGTSFSDDCGTGPGFVLSAFLRDGTDVYRTYSTTARGVDRLFFSTNILDLCPYGQGRKTGKTPRPGGRSTPPTDKQARTRPELDGRIFPGAVGPTAERGVEPIPRACCGDVCWVGASLLLDRLAGDPGGSGLRAEGRCQRLVGLRDRARGGEDDGGRRPGRERGGQVRNASQVSRRLRVRSL
jgi:predicted dithiol-disulfide oxidoreductase (DUF899 family)